MTYRVPREDIDFILRNLADLNSVLQLPANTELSQDLIDAVLDENARFVQEVVAPLNGKADVQGAHWKNGEVVTTHGYKEAFSAFAEGGWQGLLHEPEHGGQGLPKVLGAVVSENINAASLAFSLCPLLTDGVIEALATVGSSEQQKKYIPRLIEGRWTGTMNLTEPQAGSDLALVSARATPQDDGSYRIKGQKIFITFGEHDLAENIIHLVLARTPDAPKGVKGISLFLVPKYLADDDGTIGKRNDVWCASIEHKLGIHGSPTAVLLYGAGKGEVGEGAVAYLVGEENLGLQYMFIMMNAARYAVGIQGIAVAERAFQLANHYAHERLQGQDIEGSDGPVAIARHPDVDRMLQTMKGLTEGSRAVAYWAAVANDMSRGHPEVELRTQAKALYEFLVPVVKAFSTEMSIEVTSLGIQVHGGMGYIEETGAAQYYRDARILTIYEGTTAIQANDFVGRKVLRDGGKVAYSLAQSMRDTLAELRKQAAGGSEDAAGLKLIAMRLEDAIQAYERGIAFTLTHAKQQLRAIFYGSVPLLMLTGTVLAGWQLARAALVCTGPDSGQSARFEKQKVATAVFYAAGVLPRAAAYADTIESGISLEHYAAQLHVQ